MNQISCLRFEYISCRGNREIDFEIAKPYNKCTIVQFEDNCPKRVMRNVGSGYLRCSRDLIKHCNPTSILDDIQMCWAEIDENE